MTFRIPLVPFMEQDEGELRRNIAANAHLPRIAREAQDKPLAICGGGPSLAGHIAALRGWDGLVWAVNRTPAWLKAHGIASTLVSVDACADPDAFAESGEAIFSSWCNPAVVGRYSARVIDMWPLVPDGMVGTTTTAGSMAIAAFRMGFGLVTLFGCEGSFVDDDHVDFHEDAADQLIIRADGADYRTTPGLLLQCEELSRLIREFPANLIERSGGLLRAMIADPDWATVAVSESMAARVFPGAELADFPHLKETNQ